MNGDIFRYAVKQDISESPMYGKARLLYPYYESRDEAIAAAKALVVKYGRSKIFVEERQYASQRNVERDFTLYCRIAWADWFHSL